MPQPTLTAQEITSGYTILGNSADQISEAVRRAAAAIKNLEGLKSPRYLRDIERWQNLQRNITDAVMALRDASTELKHFDAPGSEFDSQR